MLRRTERRSQQKPVPGATPRCLTCFRVSPQSPRNAPRMWRFSGRTCVRRAPHCASCAQNCACNIHPVATCAVAAGRVNPRSMVSNILPKHMSSCGVSSVCWVEAVFQGSILAGQQTWMVIGGLIPCQWSHMQARHFKGRQPVGRVSLPVLACVLCLLAVCLLA